MTQAEDKQISENAARTLLERVASAENGLALAALADKSPFSLNANFFEKLHWQADQWQLNGDPFAAIGQRAFDRLWEWRYRRIDVDHCVTADARAFVETLLALGNPAQISASAQAQASQFSPNLVEGILSADVMFEIADPQIRSALNEIAGLAAQGLGMRLVHMPPKTLRDAFVWQFVELYHAGNLMRAMTSTPTILLEQIGFTMAGILDALQAEERLGTDARLTTFVNFLEAFALHLTQRRPGAGDPSHTVAVNLYEALIGIYEAQGFDAEFANAVANQGKLNLTSRVD